MGSLGVDISFLDNTASFSGKTDMAITSEEEITSFDKQQNPHPSSWPLQMIPLNSAVTERSTAKAGATTITPGSVDMDDFQQTAQFFFPEFHSSKKEYTISKNNHGQLHDILRKDTNSNQYSQLFIKKLNSCGQSESKQRIIASRSQPRLHQKTPVKSSRLFAQGEMGFPALSFKEDKQFQSGRPIAIRHNNTRLSVHSKCDFQRQTEIQRNNENVDNYSFNSSSNNSNNYLQQKQGLDSNFAKKSSIHTTNSLGKSKLNQNADQFSQPKPLELPDKDSDPWSLHRIPSKVPSSSSSSSSSVSTSTSITSKLPQQQSLISLPLPPNPKIMTFGFAKTNRNLIQHTLPTANYFSENPEQNLLDENLLESLKKQQILYNRIREQQQSQQLQQQQQSKNFDGCYSPKTFTTPDKSQLKSAKSFQKDDPQYSHESQSHQSQFPMLKHSQSTNHITQTQPSSCHYLRNDLKSKENLRQSQPQVTTVSIIPDSIYGINRQQFISQSRSSHAPNNIRHSYNSDLKFINTKAFQKDPPSMMINFGALKKRIDFEETTVDSVTKQTTTGRDTTNSRRKFHSLHQAQVAPSFTAIHGVDTNLQQSSTNDLENARSFIRQTISNGNGYKVLQQFQSQNPGSSTNKQLEIFSELKRTGCCLPIRKLSSPPSPLLSDARFIFSEEALSSQREAKTADTAATSQTNKINESKLKTFLQRKPQENILNKIFHNQIDLIEARE